MLWENTSVNSGRNIFSFTCHTYLIVCTMVLYVIQQCQLCWFLQGLCQGTVVASGEPIYPKESFHKQQTKPRPLTWVSVVTISCQGSSCALSLAGLPSHWDEDSRGRGRLGNGAGRTVQGRRISNNAPLTSSNVTQWVTLSQSQCWRLCRSTRSSSTSRAREFEHHYFQRRYKLLGTTAN